MTRISQKTMQARLDEFSELAKLIASKLDGLNNGSQTYSWRVGKLALARLRELGIEFEGQSLSPAKFNIALRERLHHYWIAATSEKRGDLAEWIIKEWGGIKRNSAKTISGYVAMTATETPETPFHGVSSYSKVLSVHNPFRFAIYDARVAAALNAIQLIEHTRHPEIQLVAYKCPPSRNKKIVDFCRAFSQEALMSRFGFQRLPPDGVYEYYISLLVALRARTGRSILDLEMQLFGQSELLCLEARSVSRT